MVRFAGEEPVVFVTSFAALGRLRSFAHRALCASAIFRREAAEIIRFGWLVGRDDPEPFNDSITVIA